MAQQQLPIMSPLKGVVRAVGREQQTPDTCWDAISVLPYDRYGRRRLSQRGGLAKQFPNQMNASFVQGMIEAPNIVYPPNPLTVPQLSFDDIGFTFPLTTPGNYGPFTVPAQVSWGVDYTWTLTANIAGSMTVTWTDGSGAGGLAAGSGDIVLTVDVGASPSYYYITLSGGAAWRNQGSGGPVTASVGVNVTYGTFAGQHSVGSNTINLTPPADDSTTGSWSGTCTVVLTLTEFIINGGSSIGTPLAATQFPQVTSASGAVSQSITGGDGVVDSISFAVND